MGTSARTPDQAWKRRAVREGDAFFRDPDAGKILVIGAVEVIDRDVNQARPRRKHAKYLDTRSGRIRLAMIANNSATVDRSFREGQRDSAEPR